MIHPAQKLCCSSTHLYYAIGQTILACAWDKSAQSTTDHTTLWTGAPLTALEKGKNVRNRAVIEMCIYEDHLVWISEDKMLRVYDVRSRTLLNERELVKRGCSIDVVRDLIVVGDKFGDVYQFPMLQEDTASVNAEHSPVLGHVSMLTCVRLTSEVEGKRSLITADRDEHIRISNFPDGYNIRNYCLGHSQFVSALLLTRDQTLISGGGDDHLAVWDISIGKQIRQIALTEPAQNAASAKIGLTVLKILLIEPKLILVLFHGLKTIYLYDYTTGELSCTISTILPVLDATLGNNTDLVVSYDTTAVASNNNAELFGRWSLSTIEGAMSSVTITARALNDASRRITDTVEYTTQTADLLRKRTKAEIEKSRLERKDREEAAPVDKDLKRAMDEDKAQTEKLLKRVKT